MWHKSYRYSGLSSLTRQTPFHGKFLLFFKFLRLNGGSILVKWYEPIFTKMRVYKTLFHPKIIGEDNPSCSTPLMAKIHDKLYQYYT